MKIAAIIPVRMGSTRYPGKPLALIHGMTMLEHVYRRTTLAPGVNAGVYVATPDGEIARAAEGFGAPVAMTSIKHTRASDRVAEACEALDVDIVVMIQGDEPLITPEMVDMSFQPLLEDKTLFCTNLVKRIETEEEYRDPNTIKVVMDRNGEAEFQCGTTGAARMAQEAGVKKLVLVHIGPNLSEQGPVEHGISEIKKLYDGQLVFSEELMSIEM